MFDTVKIVGGFAVVDNHGDVVIAYRDKKTAELVATSHAKGTFTAAEEDNIRFDYIRAYIVSRKNRAAVEDAQMGFAF